VRIVLDTNAVVSALLWRGTPYRLLEAARQRDQVQLFTSTVLLEEFADVLLRPVPVNKRLAILGMTARQVLADYVDAVDLVTPLSVPAIIADDPDDDHVIAAAVAAEADLIVSGDKHLLRIGTHAGIRIVTPAEALAAITAASA
jgi:putative PIN family toxin of toxin-antitoxin system